MARPKHDPDRPPTRELILEAAETAFARDSYDNVRLSDIADEVGISRPSVLYHVDSKEELYAEVVESLFERLSEALAAEFLEHPGSEELLEGIVTRFETFVDEVPAFAPIVLREIIDGRGPGRDAFVTSAGPLLDHLEVALVDQGVVDADFPVREAVLQIAMGVFVRSAAREIRGELWGETRRTLEMVRGLVRGWSS